MAENNQGKKKRFVYKSFVGNKNQNRHEPAPPLVDFPDDFDMLSQPCKKQKLNSDKKSSITKKEVDNLLDGIDFEDDEDDFDLNEIEQIEIAASQMLVDKKKSQMKPIPKIDALDQLLNFTSSRPSTQVAKKSNPAVNGANTLFSKGSNPVVSGTNTISSKAASTVSSKGPHSVSNKAESKPSTIYLPLSQRQEATKMRAPSQHHQNIKEDNGLEKSFQKQYHQSQKMASEYKTQVETMQRKFNVKDGEIKILRDKLRKSSEDEQKSKEKIITLENVSRTEQSKKETDLLKEVEKLKTQLEFKEKEIKDALEKQKRLERPRKPSFVSPTKVESLPDGFKAGTKQLAKSSSKVSLTQGLANEEGKLKPNTELLKDNSWTSLKNVLQKNSIHVLPSIRIIKKLSSIHLAYQTFVTENYICNHPKHHPSSIDVTKCQNEIQLSLELLEQNDFFVVEFLKKILIYLKYLGELFAIQVEKDVLSPSEEAQKVSKEKLKRKDSGHTICPICSNLLDVGYKSLYALKEACQENNCIRERLLNCFVAKIKKSKKSGKNSNQQKQDAKVEIYATEYFHKFDGDTFLLVKNLDSVHSKKDEEVLVTDLESGVTLWEQLIQLRENKIWSSSLEELYFEFVVCLLSSSKKPPSTSSFLKYMMEKNVVERYLSGLSVQTIPRVKQVLQLLTNCVTMKEILEMLCTKSESCPLLAFYHIFLLHTDGKDEILQVFFMVVRLFSSLISQYGSKAYQLLLCNRCQCSTDIIECFISIMYDEFKILRKKIFNILLKELSDEYKERVSMFRQSMSLFCKLCSNDKFLGDKRSAVEWSYFNLLTGSIKLYRKIPDVREYEVIAIEDLLELDQFLDFEDEEEAVAGGDQKMKNNQVEE